MTVTCLLAPLLVAPRPVLELPFLSESSLSYLKLSLVYGNFVQKTVLWSLLNNAARPLPLGSDAGFCGHGPTTWPQKQDLKRGA